MLKIIYSSKTDLAKEYANIVATELAIPMYTLKEAKQNVHHGDKIIFISWIKANHLVDLEKIKKNYETIAIGAVGAKQFSKVYEEELAIANSLQDTPFFYLPGGIIWDKLKGMDKFLLNLMRKFLLKSIYEKPQEELEKDDELTIKMFTEGTSLVDKMHTFELLRWCKAYDLLDGKLHIDINGKEYVIKKLLGKGKGGYSFLARFGDELVIYKQIHHEPCEYYQFGDKFQSEIDDYNRLSKIGVRMPKMLDYDKQKEAIIKEYIVGPTIYDLVERDLMKPIYLEQMEVTCQLLYQNNTNIDYFPTNFVVMNNLLYYVDYECNDYMKKWDFANWGEQYWSKTPAFLDYQKNRVAN